jgi:hypothetical protein
VTPNGVAPSTAPLEKPTTTRRSPVLVRQPHARAAVPGRPPVPGTGRYDARRGQKLWPLTAMQPALRLTLEPTDGQSRAGP